MPLNVKVGSHRRFEWVRADLGQFKRIKSALGGTVNDVVLAVVTGALRRWLHARGVRTEGMELRAQVPVSIRAADERGHLGNKLAVLRGPIPVYVEDPVKRLEICRRGMEGIKESKQALGAEVISRFNDFAPPTLLAQAARVNFSTRLFNLVVTNVPGPQIPLYVLGRELEDIFPVGFLPPEQALFVAIMSYNGGINFGLLADYDAIDDVAALADGIEGSIAELAEAADEASSARPPSARSRRPPELARSDRAAGTRGDHERARRRRSGRCTRRTRAQTSLPAGPPTNSARTASTMVENGLMSSANDCSQSGIDSGGHERRGDEGEREDRDEAERVRGLGRGRHSPTQANTHEKA